MSCAYQCYCLHKTPALYTSLFLGKNGVSREFIITSQLLKLFEVDSSHMSLSSEVKSSEVECYQVKWWLTCSHFSLKSGHISVLQSAATHGYGYWC